MFLITHEDYSSLEFLIAKCLGYPAAGLPCAYDNNRLHYRVLFEPSASGNQPLTQDTNVLSRSINATTFSKAADLHMTLPYTAREPIVSCGMNILVASVKAKQARVVVDSYRRLSC